MRRPSVRSFATQLLLLAGASIGAGAAYAQEDGARLVENARCYICHQMTEYSLAPPYLAIAARHAPRREVMVDVLASKIVHGGGGNWGVVPMVPNQWVSPADARIMAAWILSLAD
jgi:cytochrome c